MSEKIAESAEHNWSVETNYPRTPAFRVVQPRLPGSGVLDTVVETDDESVARLIASAPDLLAALKLYMAAVEQMNSAMKDGLNVHGAMAALVGAGDMANHAIACAEGQS